MKTLITMRHGHAEDRAATDFARKLTADGLVAVNAAAVNLRAAGLRPDLILCSAAARARQTAERVAAVLGMEDGKIIASRSFYYIDDYELLHEIQQTGDEFNTLMVVGHNPAVSALVSGIGGEMYAMRPAELAILQDDGDCWKTFGARIASVRYI